MITNNISQLVGNTPLIKLRGVSELTGCNIYGKAEFMNPGESVKDRAALYIIRDAEERGLLKPGSTIVEGTAGNTGIGLTIIGSALGYKTVIVIPQTQSEEKKSALRMLGAKLIEVPAVPYSNPDNYVRYSQRVAADLDAVWANQFDNVANRRAHIEGTGPEIWKQLDGKVDGFICAAGSGATVAGVGMALKKYSSSVVIGLADPAGAALHSWYSTGEFASTGNSISEGIGQGRITANLDNAPIDISWQIEDDEGLRCIFDLVEHEGICLGLSSGINIAGAVRLARMMGPGHNIVTILCDNGSRYASKVYNPDFLKQRDLFVPKWLETAR